MAGIINLSSSEILGQVYLCKNGARRVRRRAQWEPKTTATSKSPRQHLAYHHFIYRLERAEVLGRAAPSRTSIYLARALSKPRDSPIIHIIADTASLDNEFSRLYQPAHYGHACAVRWQPSSPWVNAAATRRKWSIICDACVNIN